MNNRFCVAMLIVVLIMVFAGCQKTVSVSYIDPADPYTGWFKLVATGRFLGKGLYADRKIIREPLLNLPVYQPGIRPEWHRFDFMDARGHLINRAGLEIDDRFRPVDSSGKPVFENLFAAGSILAHQDWMRMKCGSGLAMATAFAAVHAFLE